MADIALVAPPPIANVANVELMHTGTWDLSTGPATFTVEDLASAVAALDCPAVRRPILKLGHTPNPLPGQPAIGFVANLATAEDGRTLVGDYVGLPGWLAVADDAGNSVLSSAYPDRSIEGQYDFRCQIGHTHPFVLTAVALLGAEQPGIGTLQSLQDLADLYGVAAAAEPADGAIAVTIPIRASEEDRVPNPHAPQVAAGVSTEDVRRAFYASPMGAGWSTWIEEMQLDPLQLIVMDDTSGTRSRVPVTIGDGDGEEAVAFGDAVKVVIRYDDAPAAVAARAAIRYATRDESRPASPPTPPARQPEAPAETGASSRTPSAAQAMRRIHAATQTPAAGQPAVAAPQEGAGMDPAMLRESLGLAPDASDDEVRTAFASSLAPPTPDPAPAGETAAVPAASAAAAAVTSDAVILDPAQYAALRAQAMRGDEAWRKMREAECEQILDAAIKAGKFPPARRDHWKALWAADPDGTKATIDKLAANVIPVLASGFPGVGDEAEVDIVYAAMYGDKAGAGRG